MPKLTPENIMFFEKPLQFREWLMKNSTNSKELWVGFYKRDSGKPSITWPEAVDQALCFGWIDGIRKSIDHLSYTIRFTPRNPKSIWSDINVKKVEELKNEGLMTPEGLKLFETRIHNKSGIYSFEQETIALTDAYLKTFASNKKAWENFLKMPPSYQKTATWWVISAKQETTRIKRLETLIADSENNIKIVPLRR